MCAFFAHKLSRNGLCIRAGFPANIRKPVENGVEMAFIPINAPLREPDSCVKTSPVLQMLRAAFRWIKPDNSPHIREINPRHARDIGLSDADLAVHQHRLPSQHTHHPRG
jgi:hypothetical protein